MEIKTAAILGTGAVGSYLLWGLTEKMEDRLWVIAQGERKARLKKQGLIINGRKYRPNLKTPEEAHGADLVIVATKSGSLGQVLEDLKKITAPNTVIISLLNGIGSEEEISAAVGKEHVIYSMIKIASERSGNKITFDGENTQGIYFGEAKTPEPTERIKAVADLFEGTPLHYTVCRDIIKELWGKFALNIGYNLPQAIIGCGVGAYRDSKHMKHLLEALTDEVVAVAKAKGINIEDEAEQLKTRPLLKKSAKYSTLQDLEAGRHTEIEIFAGQMMTLGRETKTPTPYSEFAYHTIKALEEKNDGKFNYK